MTNTMKLFSILLVVAIMVVNTRVWAAPYEANRAYNFLEDMFLGERTVGLFLTSVYLSPEF